MGPLGTLGGEFGGLALGEFSGGLALGKLGGGLARFGPSLPFLLRNCLLFTKAILSFFLTLCLKPLSFGQSVKACMYIISEKGSLNIICMHTKKLK